MTEHALIFLAGLAGSMHCVGMCGGFACAMGGDARGPAASLARHLVYNIGRVSSYCFLGALVGYSGALLVGHGGEGSAGSNAQRALALLSGALMVFIGLQFLGVLRRSAPALLGAGEGLAASVRGLLKAPGFAAPLAFGVLNGLLPCPLVYAFAAQAAASGGPLAGVQIMAAFGLGTFPAMLAMGGIALWWRRAPVVHAVHATFLPPAAPALDWRTLGVLHTDGRTLGVRVAGCFIVLLGLVTLARGVLPMAAHLHG